MNFFYSTILSFIIVIINFTPASSMIVFSDNDYGCGWENNAYTITIQNSWEVGTNLAVYAANGSKNINIMQIKYDGDWNPDPGSIENLRDQINLKTNLSVTTSSSELSYTSIHNVNMLYITGHEPFTLSEAEKFFLKFYIVKGGFLFADDCNNKETDDKFEASFRAIVEDMFGTTLTIMPSNHLVYSSFYSLNGDDFSYSDIGNGTQWNTEPLEFFVPSYKLEIHSDSDNDGVINELDLCPNTKNELAVYSNGCAATNLYQSITQLTSDNESLTQYIQTLNFEIESMENEIIKANDSIIDYSLTNKDLQNKIEKQNQILTTDQITISNLNTLIENQRYDVEEKNKYINELTLIISNMYTEEDVQTHVQTALANINVYTGYSIQLTQGWHLLSSINNKVAPKTIPENSVEVIYKYFSGSYQQVNELVPKYGHWIKVNQPCELILK